MARSIVLVLIFLLCYCVFITVCDDTIPEAVSPVNIFFHLFLNVFLDADFTDFHWFFNGFGGI